MPPEHPERPYREINDAIIQASKASDPSMPRRRRVPRQRTSWFGRCRVGDVPDWGDCEVVDVSVIGVGVYVSTPGSPEHLVGSRIAIEVRAAAGGSVSLQLAGEIRNVQLAADGRLRVGVEFSGLSESERAILDALEYMGVVW